MNNQDILERFEELEAGRIIGDLDADEVKEWEELAADPRCQTDLSLEFTAAALEAEFLGDRGNDLPAGLLEKLRGDLPGTPVTGSEKEKIVPLPQSPGFLSSPKVAWAIAALFAVLFTAKSLVDNTPDGPENPVVTAPEDWSPEKARDTLISKAGDLIQSKFDGTDNFNQMSGTVVWSDELQEGYMSLSNLPANDPNARQYQLWIVDPARDEKPVDGGVFDIEASNGTAVIPIRNPLTVSKPKAFVITLEQPGGVVVSRQEVVVALAKTS